MTEVIYDCAVESETHDLFVIGDGNEHSISDLKDCGVDCRGPRTLLHCAFHKLREVGAAPAAYARGTCERRSCSAYRS